MPKSLEITDRAIRWVERLSDGPAAATGLPNDAYTTREALEADHRAIFQRHWMAVGHAADVAEPGDVAPVDIAGVPILLTRDKSGALHVFHNVCTHRGLKLVEVARDRRPTIVCPYHGWSFDLSGGLRATPGMGGHGVHTAPDFDPGLFGLSPIRHVEAIGGIVFVDLSGTAPEFADWAAPLLSRWSDYRFDLLRHAHRETCTVHANWKLVAENFQDTLHLDWVHPQVVGHSRPEDHYDVIEPPVYGSGSLTAFPDDPTARAAPSFPGLPEVRAIRGEFLMLYPNILFGLMPNHLFSIILDPASPDRTDERLDLSVVSDGGAETPVETIRYWADFWRGLNDQDLAVVARLQAGRASPGFDGGCFSAAMDQVAHAFQRRVATDLSAGA